MAIINQKYELVNVAVLKPHPENPRKGALMDIEESVDTNGFYGAVIAQKSTGHILAGTHRWKAAQNVGEEMVPVLWADVDNKQAVKILLADNRTSDLATYDQDKLSAILEGLDDLSGTGFSEVVAKAEEKRLAAKEAEAREDLDGIDEPVFVVQIHCADEADQAEVLAKLNDGRVKWSKGRTMAAVTL